MTFWMPWWQVRFLCILDFGSRSLLVFSQQTPKLLHFFGFGRMPSFLVDFWYVPQCKANHCFLSRTLWHKFDMNLLTILDKASRILRLNSLVEEHRSSFPPLENVNVDAVSRFYWNCVKFSFFLHLLFTIFKAVLDLESIFRFFWHFAIKRTILIKQICIFIKWFFSMYLVKASYVRRLPKI